jgi:hypothetical protein
VGFKKLRAGTFGDEHERQTHGDSGRKRPKTRRREGQRAVAEGYKGLTNRAKAPKGEVAMKGSKGSAKGKPSTQRPKGGKGGKVKAPKEGYGSY